MKKGNNEKSTFTLHVYVQRQEIQILSLLSILFLTPK